MAESTPQEKLRTAVAGFRAFVEDARDSFADGFPHAEDRTQAPASRAATPLLAAPRSVLPRDALRAIRDEIGDCRRCKLATGRTNIVFGVGNPAAELMFVGEGPGEDEDRKGEPFVGRAGQLLTEIITHGMGLRRDDVYIANVVKCRPPGNRNPEPDEISACQPFLSAQIDAVAPKVIVALGKFAAQTLLGTTMPISKLRGRWFDFRGRRLMPTFHPSYLLRTPSEKKLAWEDIKLVMQELDLPLPKAPKPRT
jgi:DNA polymerase